MNDPTTATLVQVRAWVAERMKGSPEPVDACRITCLCGEHEEFETEGDDGEMYCEGCIGAAVDRLGFEEGDFVLVQDPDEEDRPRWCDGCEALFVGELENVDEELDHWLADDHHAPSTPEEWREFSMCLVEPPDAELPRIRAVIARALADGSPS